MRNYLMTTAAAAALLAAQPVYAASPTDIRESIAGSSENGWFSVSDYTFSGFSVSRLTFNIDGWACDAQALTDLDLVQLSGHVKRGDATSEPLVNEGEDCIIGPPRCRLCLRRH